MPDIFQTSKSDLAGARDTGNAEFLETTFKGNQLFFPINLKK
jgi:hypothetical protein